MRLYRPNAKRPILGEPLFRTTIPQHLCALQRFSVQLDAQQGIIPIRTTIPKSIRTLRRFSVQLKAQQGILPISAINGPAAARRLVVKSSSLPVFPVFPVIPVLPFIQSIQSKSPLFGCGYAALSIRCVPWLVVLGVFPRTGERGKSSFNHGILGTHGKEQRFSFWLIRVERRCLGYTRMNPIPNKPFSCVFGVFRGSWSYRRIKTAARNPHRLDTAPQHFRSYLGGAAPGHLVFGNRLEAHVQSHDIGDPRPVSGRRP